MTGRGSSGMSVCVLGGNIVEKRIPESGAEKASR